MSKYKIEKLNTLISVKDKLDYIKTRRKIIRKKTYFKKNCRNVLMYHS